MNAVAEVGRTSSGLSMDALIIVPPPSPSDSNPPLGPMVISQAASRRGLNVAILDLNIRYLNTYRHLGEGQPVRALGDHGKNRGLVAAAADEFFTSAGLRDLEPFHLPDAADAAAGMHFDFASLERAVGGADSAGSPWPAWVEEQISEFAVSPPPVIGISLMGPSQVFICLIAAEVIKRRWPSVTVVLGGSHATLLADEMRRDRRYLRNIDLVLPGHSEEEFTNLLLTQSPSSVKRRHLIEPPPAAGTTFDYFPLISADDLGLYDPQIATLPVQFTRGCVYGRCTFCTYPVVEPVVTPFDAPRAASAVRRLTRDHHLTRFSIKDSLFTLPMMLAFASSLDEAGLRVQWSATTKANRSLIRHAARLASAGLTTLEIGVETIHPSGQRLFNKPAEKGMIEDVILACAASGIVVVTNLIFGLPDETADDAHRQLDWFRALRGSAGPEWVDGSLNLLEIVRGSPLAARPPEGVVLRGIAPWAYCYEWNAPSWRGEFLPLIAQEEFAGR